MPENNPARLFIIAGDAHFLYLMRRYSRKVSHQAVFGNVTEDLIEKISSSRPAVIIIELGNSEKIGWHIIRTIRSYPTTKDIPIVICSWQDDEERARQAGVNVYLRMPILYQDFLAALQTLNLRN